ncbi:MAG TPA: hypothetical protein VGO62_10645 [Myxococcota bacterium]|jgi:hypothetical protein
MRNTMTKTTRLRARKRRGYVLMEAMISGSLIALMLATTFTIIAAARADIGYTSRRAGAVTVCRQKLDELSTLATIVPVAQATIPVDGVNFPGLTWDWSVVDQTAFYAGKSPLGFPSGNTLWEITVNVHYPTPSGTLGTFTEKILRER